MSKVSAKMGKLFRQSKRGEISLEEYRVWNDGLNKLREGMLAAELEARLKSLENFQTPKPPIMLKAVK